MGLPASEVEALRRAALEDRDSVVELTRRLVCHPSQGGVDE